MPTDRYTGDGTNDAFFAILTLWVVVPALTAAGGWVYGLCGEPQDLAR